MISASEQATKKVLLLQPQFLAQVEGIVGVEDPGQVFSLHPVGNRLGVVAALKS